MFCPQCEAEYRQGFTRCGDCDVDLVYSLPQESPAPSESLASQFDGQRSELRLVWRGYDPEECLALCRVLLEEDIPYKVAETSMARTVEMRVKWLYEIGILSADYQRAKKLLGIEGEFADSCYDLNSDQGDGGDAQASGSGESIAVDNQPPDAEIRNDSYLQPWYPEDATVEVWSQDGDDISSGVAMALKENLIQCRLDRQDGACKALVLPENEVRAREIVREILEGELPE
jgi:hypothetical protein